MSGTKVKNHTSTFLLQVPKNKCLVFIFTERAAREAPAAWSVDQSLMTLSCTEGRREVVCDVREGGLMLVVAGLLAHRCRQTCLTAPASLNQHFCAQRWQIVAERFWIV